MGRGRPALRVALVGCGTHARRRLVPAIRRVAGLHLEALCDTDPAGTADLARRLGLPRVYERVEAMLEAARPEVVVIATPPRTHLQVSRACLAAGAHCYVEKPLADTPAAALDLARRAAQSGRVAMVGHHLRFGRIERRLAAHLASGRIGALRLVSVVHHFSHASRAARSGYLGRPREAGGVLDEYATHELDFLEFCLGRPIRQVWAQIDPPGGPEHSATVGLRLEGGLLANLSFCASTVDHEVREYFGAEGMLTLDRYRFGAPVLDLAPALANRPRRALGQFWKGWRSLALAQYLRPGALSEPYRLAFIALEAAVREGRPAAPGMAEGLRAVRLAHRCRESARLGRVLDVPADWGAPADLAGPRPALEPEPAEVPR